MFWIGWGIVAVASTGSGVGGGSVDVKACVYVALILAVPELWMWLTTLGAEVFVVA